MVKAVYRTVQTANFVAHIQRKRRAKALANSTSNAMQEEVRSCITVHRTALLVLDVAVYSVIVVASHYKRLSLLPTLSKLRACNLTQ
jgi:hypothetical protein